MDLNSELWCGGQSTALGDKALGSSLIMPLSSYHVGCIFQAGLSSDFLTVWPMRAVEEDEKETGEESGYLSLFFAFCKAAAGLLFFL